jgi:hypothetical protein
MIDSVFDKGRPVLAEKRVTRRTFDAYVRCDRGKIPVVDKLKVKKFSMGALTEL